MKLERGKLIINEPFWKHPNNEKEIIMNTYIKKEDIGLTDFEIILCQADENKYKSALIILLDKIKNTPAADVRPVVRGKWEKQDANLVWNDVGLYAAAYKCNRCGEFNIAGTNFCPNCGADMREEQT